MLAYANREEWLEQRRKGIGGSDSPVIVLPNYPYKTPYDLWLEKRGQAQEQEINKAMERGTRLEPIAAEIFKEKTGFKIRRKNKILQHRKYPWFLGNIDREIINDAGKKGVLEIKCPGIRQFAKIKRDGVPEHYLIQLQHYLQFGYDYGYFAVFSAELMELIKFEIRKDQEIGELIIEKDGEFWKHVVNGIPPQQTEKVIQFPKLPAVEGEVKRIESPAFLDAIKEYQEAQAILDEVKELQESAKSRIKNLMEQAGADVAECGGFRIYHLEQAGMVTFDSKTFKKHHSNIDYTPYDKVSDPSRPLKIYKIKEEKNNGHDRI